MPSQPGRNKNCFIFQHGWGFGAGAWNAWRQFLSGGSPCQFLDRGYWPPPIKPAFIVKHRHILITHSLGLHFCVPWLGDIDRLVIISGFEHFHGSESPSGGTRKHLRMMLNRLDNDVAGLLRDFYRNCQFPGGPPTGDGLDTTLLRDDLYLLDTSFVALKKIQKIPRILILHGNDDRIVSLERAQELHFHLPGSGLKLIPGAGHGLPFTHAAICWQIISDFCTIYDHER